MLNPNNISLIQLIEYVLLGLSIGLMFLFKLPKWLSWASLLLFIAALICIVVTSHNLGSDLNNNSHPCKPTSDSMWDKCNLKIAL